MITACAGISGLLLGVAIRHIASRFLKKTKEQQELPIEEFDFFKSLFNDMEGNPGDWDLITTDIYQHKTAGLLISLCDTSDEKNKKYQPMVYSWPKKNLSLKIIHELKPHEVQRIKNLFKEFEYFKFASHQDKNE